MVSREDDVPFVEAMQDLLADETSGVAYLGRPDVVEAVLRSAAADALSGVTPDELKAISMNFAKEFLGKGTCKGIPGWNEPGKIDAFLRRNGHAHETDDANQAVGSVFLSMVEDLLEIEQFANQEGVLEEQWTGEVDYIYQRYRMILTGIEPGSLDGLMQEAEILPPPTGPIPKSKRFTKTQEALMGRWRDYP